MTILSKLQKKFKRHQRLKARRQEQARSSVNIISFPKCGRTWLRVMTGRYLMQKFGLGSSDILNTYELTSLAKLPRSIFSHDSPEINKPIHFTQYSIDTEKYRNKDVIFIVREPKDVMVSWFFQISKRRGVVVGTISDFIRNEGYGILKYLTFVNKWMEIETVAKSFTLISYEQMHLQTEFTLRTVLNIMQVGEIDETILQEAIEYSRFDNLKQLEKKGTFSSDIMKAKDTSDPDSFKVRSGKIGGYVKHLSNEDIAYIDKMTKQNGASAFLNI